MSDKPTPLVSDDYIMDVLIVNLNGRNLTKIKRHGPAAELAMDVRDLYESHLAEVIRERDELREVAKEVLKVWNEDGEAGEIQKVTPIAWYRVLRLAEALLTPNTPPSHG